jgi:S-formylglutathione hydrolase
MSNQSVNRQPTNGGSKVELGELASGYMPQPVPYAVLLPPGYSRLGPLPLCLMLMGGGGSRQNLEESRTLFEKWWGDGSVPPMVLATPSAGMSYYHDLADRSVRWEAFLADDFLRHLRSRFDLRSDPRWTAITGISMGGYGALKIAFARPKQFAAVAAMQPILEPAFKDADVGLRNRIHHASGGPKELIGPQRDAAIVEANNPVNRARSNAHAIRGSGLAIYLDVGDQDFVNAHDGTEFLHRVLWDLDVSHEYHLVRGGDHGGPTLLPRMRAMFEWVGAVFKAAEPAPESPGEQAVRSWIERGMAEDPPKVSPSSKEFLAMVRAQLRPMLDSAATNDPTTGRRFGVLPAASRKD